MKGSVKLIILASIILLFVAGYFIQKNMFAPQINENQTATIDKTPQKRGGPVTVTTIIASERLINSSITSIGTLVSNEEVDIASEIAGKIDNIYFEEGADITKGDVLVKINDSDLQAQLKRAIFQRDLLSQRLERQRVLLDKDAISRESFDQLQTDVNMLEADIELLHVKIDRTEVKAPFSGVVGFRYISQGSYIQTGSNIVHLTDRSKLKLEFYIPEKYNSKNLIGSIADFTVESYPDRKFRATVYAVDPTVDLKTRSISLRAIYDNASKELMSGLSAKVSLNEKGMTPSIFVPTEAVVPEMDGHKVWVKKDGKAMRVKVEIGHRTEDMLEIKSGIVVGDSVITAGIMQIQHNQPVVLAN